jgi:hypothetical protein
MSTRGTIPVVGSEANLPKDIAGLHYQGIFRFPNPAGGVKIRYGIPELAVADVYLYTAGLSDIPDDLWSSDVEARFEESCDLVHAAENQGMHDDLVDLDSGYLYIPAAATEPLCLWASFAYTPNTGQPLPTTDHPGRSVTDIGRKHSHLALRTDGGYINKIRYTYPAEDADKGFAAFRDFVFEWTNFIQQLPFMPTDVAEQLLSDYPDEEFSLVRHAKRSVRDSVYDLRRPDQDVLPVFMTYGKRGLSFAGIELPDDEGRRDQIAKMMAATVAYTEASEVVFICTVWMSPPLDGAITRATRPRDDPKRMEKIMLLHSHSDGTSTVHAADVIRHDNRPPDLGQWEEVEGPMGGRFSEAIELGLQLTKTVNEVPGLAEVIEQGWQSGNPRGVMPIVVSLLERSGFL